MVGSHSRISGVVIDMESKTPTKQGQQVKPPHPFTTVGKDGEYGLWKITRMPFGTQEVVELHVTATGLLAIVQKYPDTMNAEFVGKGEVLFDNDHLERMVQDVQAIKGIQAAQGRA